MPKPHHHTRTAEEMGAKARVLYRSWRAEASIQEVEARLDAMSRLLKMGHAAVDPATWVRYQGLIDDGLTRQQVGNLLVDMRCMLDMERDAVPYLPQSGMGSAGAAVLEG